MNEYTAKIRWPSHERMEYTDDIKATLEVN